MRKHLAEYTALMRPGDAAEMLADLVSGDEESQSRAVVLLDWLLEASDLAQGGCEYGDFTKASLGKALPQATPFLPQLLESKHASVRADAAALAPSFPSLSEATWDAVGRLVADDDPAVQKAATAALLEPVGHVPTRIVARLLGSQDKAVRAQAAVLCLAGDGETLRSARRVLGTGPPLDALYEHLPAAARRGASVGTLTPYIDRLLRSRDYQCWEVAARTVEALGPVGAPYASRMLRLLRYPDGGEEHPEMIASGAAAGALQSMGDAGRRALE